MLLAIPAVAAFAQDTGTSAAPTIQSDKEDYAPGSTVTLTGSGWQANETVHINVNDELGKTWSRDVDVTADANGNITDQFQLPSTFVAVYNVTATGALSGVVTSSFTDANMVITGDSSAVAGNIKSYSAAADGGNCATNLSYAWSVNNGATIQSGQGTNSVSVKFNNSGATTISVLLTGDKANGGACSQVDGTKSVAVSAAPTDSTPPVITETVSPAAPDGQNGWYKSNVSVSWTVNDPNSAITSKSAACDTITNINTDTTGQTVTCQATSAGGTASKSVTIKRDATPPTNIQFAGGPAANGSYTFGNVPNAPTCTADGAVSGLASPCAVTGYSNAVGSHTLTATATDNAGNSATQTRTYTVNKVNQTINFGVLDPKTFGDANFQVSATGGNSGEPVTFAATGNCEVVGNNVQITGAGSCTVTASQLGNANYEAATPVSRSFAIDKATTTTTITCGAGPFIYDGSAHTPCQAKVTGFGLDQLVAVDYTNNTGAGTATASASYAGDTNYKPSSSEQKTFTIGKASSTTEVTCTGGPFTYTGDPITPCSAKVTGPGGLNLTPDVVYNNNTNAGQATASYTYEESANYKSSNGEANFTIDKASSTTEVTCTGAPFTYTGDPITPCSAKATGAGGLNETVTPVSYENNVGAGTATAKASYAGDANHEGSNGSETFTIGKASSTTTVTCPANVTYTGSALTPCSAKATGAGGLNQSVNVSYTNNTDAGTATASATFAGDDNHTGSSDSKNFNITFNFTGFSSPVDNNNVLNTAKAGQAIPLKWRLTNASGNPVTNLLSTDVKVTVANYSCGLSTTTDLLEEYAAGSSGLQNLGNGYYQFNWKTPTNYANSCKTMTLDLGEGTLTTPHTALFKFTK
jgi:hypothetical protein